MSLCFPFIPLRWWVVYYLSLNQSLIYHYMYIRHTISPFHCVTSWSVFFYIVLHILCYIDITLDNVWLFCFLTCIEDKHYCFFVMSGNTVWILHSSMAYQGQPCAYPYSFGPQIPTHLPTILSLTILQTLT